MKQNSTNILQFTPKDFYRPTSNFNFHIWNHPDTALHRHHGYYELFFVTKGPIDYIINEKKLLLKEKELSIVRPNDVRHACASKNATRQYCLQGGLFPNAGEYDLALSPRHD